MTLETCKFCNEIKELQRSHVIGKAVFRKILKESEGNYAINISLGDRKIKKSNDTWEAKLLCRECEQFFNKKYEDYSYHVIRKEQNGISFKEGPNGIFFRNVDTYRVILYFFSIYWRAAHSPHKAYKATITREITSDYIKDVLKDLTILNASIFSVRIRLLKDQSGGFPPQTLKRMIFNPFFKMKEKGFVYCLVFEGYLFELFFISTNFKERQQQGFLSRSSDSFFVPYVDIFDLPELTYVLAEGLKIHHETPDDQKINK